MDLRVDQRHQQREALDLHLIRSVDQHVVRAEAAGPAARRHEEGELAVGFGLDALEYRGIANAGAITGTAMAWYAIFNGLGRIAWGSISDRLGRKRTIVVMSALQGVTMLLTYHVFITFGSVVGFIVAAALIGFNYGGSFALFPAITADYFGNKSVGSNYGWMFTAYGIAGSNPFITPMVMAMFWGILFGTLMTLILLPCLYAAEQDMRKLFRRGVTNGVEMGQ